MGEHRNSGADQHRDCRNDTTASLLCCLGTEPWQHHSNLASGGDGGMGSQAQGRPTLQGKLNL